MEFGRKVLWLVSHHDDDRKMNGQKKRKLFQLTQKSGSISLECEICGLFFGKTIFESIAARFRIANFPLCRPRVSHSRGAKQLKFFIDSQKNSFVYSLLHSLPPPARPCVHCGRVHSQITNIWATLKWNKNYIWVHTLLLPWDAGWVGNLSSNSRMKWCQRATLTKPKWTEINAAREQLFH